MSRYTLAVGTHDPEQLSALDDSEAIRQAVGLVHARYEQDLRTTPQEVATLLGPAGLLTRPAERLDEFVRRVDPLGDSFGPEGMNSPDCNLD